MKLNYEEFNPPFYWEKFNCYVLDSWYDEKGIRHHTCVGMDVWEGDVYHSAIIHKGDCMFKVGDKAKGFKFSGKQYKEVGYVTPMDDVVGRIGTVNYVGARSYTVEFPDNGYPWSYPIELWHLGKVDEDKVNPFNVGDKVKFKKNSIDSGMIDATEDSVFTVLHVSKDHIMLTERGSWWGVEHFEQAKEETVNNTEEQEIKWEIGQEVWCLLQGKGTIYDYTKEEYPVKVLFSSGKEKAYTQCGRIRFWDKNRSLFFSEPKIEAEKFPPKKPFVAKLKEGDEVLIEGPRGGQIFRREVKEETEDKVICKYAGEFEKIGYKFTKLGEEIIFN